MGAFINKDRYYVRLRHKAVPGRGKQKEGSGEFLRRWMD